jgi:hypothetical protein
MPAVTPDRAASEAVADRIALEPTADFAAPEVVADRTRSEAAAVFVAHETTSLPGDTGRAASAYPAAFSRALRDHAYPVDPATPTIRAASSALFPAPLNSKNSSRFVFVITTNCTQAKQP